MSYDRDEAMRVYQEAENAAYKPWSAAKVVMYLFLLMLAIFIMTALIRSADEPDFESTKPRQTKVNPLPDISGSDICRWSRNAGASSCSIDQSNQIIFMTVHTNASEASKMCHGMQSMLRQYGGTGWRITIRGLLGPVLATCR